MIELALSQIAEIVGGDLHGADALVTGPAFLDSRAVEQHGLFVAAIGEHTDGHEYAAAAHAAGAAGVLGSRVTAAPTVVVDDVQAATQRLASAVLAQLRESGGLVVLAITGSAGKTSTKDLLARVLADQSPTVATAGSFNNEWGLPLTVLRASRETEFLVLEMGARGIGHIAELTAIARPDVSVVLNVGTAHVGEFGSRENIAIAKGELVEALPLTGTAVLNLDDPLVAGMASRTRGRVFGFGSTESAAVRLVELSTDDFGRPEFVLERSGERAEVQMRLLGEHHALNAAAAAAAAVSVGVGLQQVAASLSAVESLSRWRMELMERADGLILINDAYNANPESMRAALRTLAGIGERTGRRTFAVLGEMRELGADSAAAHEAIGELVAELGISQLVVIGDQAAPMIEGAQRLARTWESPQLLANVHDAAEWLGQTVQAPDVVLVKASRGARLERVADELMRRLLE